MANGTLIYTYGFLAGQECKARFKDCKEPIPCLAVRYKELLFRFRWLVRLLRDP